MQRFLFLLILVVGVGLTGPARAQSVQVVVHAENPVATLSPEQVSDLFLKKTRTWPDGVSVAPVDQRRGTPLRDRFCLSVLGRRARDVEAYWQKLIFTGRAVPPTEMPSDQAILEFVGSHAGAIGYVSAGARLGPNVKVVEVR